MFNVTTPRVTLTADGNIEAATVFSNTIHRVTIDRRTGDVIEEQTNVKEGTDAFRRLVRAARKEL